MAYVAMNFQVPVDLKKLIERRSEIEKVSQTKYVLDSILFNAFTSGDPVAVKMVAGRLRRAIIDKLERLEGEGQTA